MFSFRLTHLHYAFSLSSPRRIQRFCREPTGSLSNKLEVRKWGEDTEETKSDGNYTAVRSIKGLIYVVLTASVVDMIS